MAIPPGRKGAHLFGPVGAPPPEYVAIEICSNGFICRWSDRKDASCFKTWNEVVEHIAMREHNEKLRDKKSKITIEYKRS